MSKSNFSNTLSEPHDDRWHYLDSRDTKHLENYVEWKYFNFTQKDLAGYIMYYIADPEKKTKNGGGRLLVRILKDGKIYGLVKKIEMDQIQLDAVSASIQMGNAKLTEKDSYHYELDCGFDDIAWHLTYKQDTPSIDSFKDIHASFIRWEKVSWLIKMPRAKVEGNVRIGKDEFHINAFGYSDTNWGEMVPLVTKYEWGQYNEESFSLVFGALFSMENKMNSSHFYITLGAHLVKIENAECEIKHLEWKEDKDIGIKIPVKSAFSAGNGEYEIKFTTKLLYRDNPGMKINPLLPKVVISEQIVEYEGAISENGKVIQKFKGKGFEEWSGRTWKELSLSFT